MKVKWDAALIVNLLGLLPTLITSIESLFGSGNGATKKEAVLGMSAVALNAWTSLSTGRQKETAETLAPAIGSVIDALVPVLIPKTETDTSMEGLGGGN